MNRPVVRDRVASDIPDAAAAPASAFQDDPMMETNVCACRVRRSKTMRTLSIGLSVNRDDQSMSIESDGSHPVL